MCVRVFPGFSFFGSIALPIAGELLAGVTRQEVVIGVRPEDLYINNGLHELNITAQIDDQELLGNRATLVLKACGLQITASVDAKTNFEGVKEVQLGFDPAHFHYFDPSGARVT